MIVDAHSDYAFKVYSEHAKGKKNILTDQLLPLIKRGNIKIVSVQVGGDFIECGVDGHDPINVYGMIDVMHQEIRENSEKFALLTASIDFDEITKKNKIGFLLSMEGASSINRDLSHLRNYYRLGLRSLSITHNERNIFADGLLVKHPGGLSPFGIDLIEEMNRMKILLDLVHISEKCFYEALDFYKKAPIVSHSNAKGVHDHYRNLTDEQIRAISDRGGVIGLNFIGEFIAPKEKRATVANIVDHIDYMVKVAGINHVGLGPDFTYYMVTYSDLEFAGGINDYSGIHMLLDELKKRGYSELEIRKISSENFVRIYKEILS